MKESVLLGLKYILLFIKHIYLYTKQHPKKSEENLFIDFAYIFCCNEFFSRYIIILNLEFALNNYFILFKAICVFKKSLIFMAVDSIVYFLYWRMIMTHYLTHMSYCWIVVDILYTIYCELLMQCCFKWPNIS